MCMNITNTKAYTVLEIGFASHIWTRAKDVHIVPLQSIGRRVIRIIKYGIISR